MVKMTCFIRLIETQVFEIMSYDEVENFNIVGNLGFVCAKCLRIIIFHRNFGDLMHANPSIILRNRFKYE